MRIQVSALLVLSVVGLSLGQGSVHIGGSDGLALLKNLTEGSSNHTNTDNATNSRASNATNNTVGNLSNDVHTTQGPISIGNGGKVSLKNLSNSTLNLTETNNSSELWTWGGKPLPPPVPTAEDRILYRDADVVKANRE